MGNQDSLIGKQDCLMGKQDGSDRRPIARRYTVATEWIGRPGVHS